MLKQVHLAGYRIITIKTKRLGLQETIYRYSPVAVQNLLVSAYGYTWKQRRMGGVFAQEYALAKERENFTTQQWLDYEDRQLKKIVQHAFEQVPFYTNAFTRHGLSAATIGQLTVADIHRLPVLTKAALRSQGTTGLLAAVKEKQGEFFASSGSTGTPVHILFSTAMHQRWYALFESRVRNWAGVSSTIARGMIGGRRVLPNAANTPPFYRYNYFEKQVYFSAYHISRHNAANYLQGMQRYRVQYMTGYAMSNFFLARFLKELGIQGPDLQAVITSSEKLTPAMRQVFTEVYGCKTFDGWSGVEACGLITECEQGGLHMSPDAGLIEVLDDQMQPVAAGIPGNVYCTGFLNYDQPLIRYAIGDQIILSDQTCSCGRHMPLVQEILGRVEDTITGPDGRQMVRFHSIFNGLQSVQQAQVIQEAANALLIKIVTDKGLDPAEETAIRKRIQSQLGDIDIRMEEVQQIPLNSNGKFQAVVSACKQSTL